MVKSMFKDLLKSNLFIWRYVKNVEYYFHIVESFFVSDLRKSCKKFKKNFGRYPDLSNPCTLNEKIHWLKLYDRTELHTICADKLAVRDHVAKRIGQDYLVPCYFNSDNVRDLKAENFPENTAFIIKTNHDSGGGIVVEDRDQADWKRIRGDIKFRLSKNYYYRTREWQYKNIPPKILAEKLLVDSKNGTPWDYKLHCFNGKVEIIQVDISRGTPNQCRNWFDVNWETMPFEWPARLKTGGFSSTYKGEISRPKLLDKMIELSELLASDFDYVRVDWYEVDGKLYFGEITFHHESGSIPITSDSWDNRLGQMVSLSRSKS